MCTQYARMVLAVSLSLFIALFSYSVFATEPVRGIYLTQTSMEDTRYLNYLIAQAKLSGINTFVVDLELPSKRYQKNVNLLKDNHIHYVARVMIFPGGGTAEQVESEAYWEKKYRLVQYAIDYGAEQIQLDYIRYSSKQKPSPENAKNILKVITWFKDRISQHHLPLQIDTFGIASFGESKYIGQNLKLFAETVDAICPMVYPSHYEPFRVHAVTPYQTVYTSLKAIKAQFHGEEPMKVIAFIEIFNYRYPLSGQKRIDYVNAEMKAVEDAGAEGWYVWSAHNEYDFLFNLLKSQNGDSKALTSNAEDEEIIKNRPKNNNYSKIDFKSMSPFQPSYCSLIDCKSSVWNAAIL